MVSHKIQRYIRAYGSVMTRLLVTETFKEFFRDNPAGVFTRAAAGNSSSTTASNQAFLHAVLLIGEQVSHICRPAI